MSPAERVSGTAFKEGTEVTTLTKASNFGKVTNVIKVGKKIKYQIDWSGQRHETNGTIWYDHFSIRRLDKHKSKIYKKIKAVWDDVSEDIKLEAFNEAKEYLMMMPCEYPIDDVHGALEEVGYPYGLQTVMKTLLKPLTMHVETDFGKSEELMLVKHTTPTYPTEIYNGRSESGDKLVGEKIRKTFEGQVYEGEVMKSDSDFYRVEYDDGDKEDMEGFEIIRYLWPRPKLPPCLGRSFGMLELFAGSCVMSGAFYHQEWATASHDIDPNSNASIKSDILSLDPEQLPFVPDCIWASSPPCHRSISDNELDRSPVARLHNLIFMKMIQIMAWAKQKHPHLIICIETPVGKMKDMPLMKEFIRHFQLYNVIVDHRMFGRDEKKHTQLWSNCKNLCDHFRDYYNCSHLNGNHHTIRSNTVHSSIPEPLAKECARVVNSRLVLDRVHRISAAKPARPQVRRPKRECDATNSEH